MPSDWSEQYRRMLRTFRRLEGHAEGRLPGDSDDAGDALVHFFQDAYHLKDWIKSDELVPRAAARAVERDLFCRGNHRHCNGHPLGSLATRIGADMCNGTKHYELKPGTRRLPDTALVSTLIRVVVGSPPGTPSKYGWEILADDQMHDGLALARAIVAAWEHWLVTNGLATGEPYRGPTQTQVSQPPPFRFGCSHS